MKLKIEYCLNCKNPFTKKAGSRQVYCSKDCNFDYIGWTVDEDSGCWIWNGSFRKDGYSTFRSGGAYRYMCNRYHGPPPVGKNLAMHSCDNIKCVNPHHLSWGSYLDNSDDKIQKNRHIYGEDSKKAKLTNEQVREIKIILHNETYDRLSSIADYYGVSTETISCIKHKRNWGWLDI